MVGCFAALAVERRYPTRESVGQDNNSVPTKKVTHMQQVLVEDNGEFEDTEEAFYIPEVETVMSAERSSDAKTEGVANICHDRGPEGCVVDVVGEKLDGPS